MTEFFNLKKHKRIILIIAGIDVILCLIALFMFIGMKSFAERDIHQQAAARWSSSNSEFAQVSVYMDDDEEIGSADVRAVRSSIYRKLNDDSLLPKDDSRVWIDAYSKLDTTITLRKDDNTLGVNAILYGGDFFAIHPLYLISGSYPDSSIDGDAHKILLDDYAAWSLFGSSDIVGKQVWIKDTIYTVTGVVKTPENRDELQAYGNGYYAYIPIENFKDTYATCYEAVLPNPVENYALNAVSKAFGKDNDMELSDTNTRSVLSYEGIEIIENTNRFKASSLFRKMKSRKYIDMKTTAIVYPYWENFARFEESKMMGGLRLVILLMIPAALTVLYLLIGVYFILEAIPEKIRAKRRPSYMM